MTDEELLEAALNVMNAVESHHWDLEAVVWDENPDPVQMSQRREEGDRTTADRYAVTVR